MVAPTNAVTTLLVDDDADMRLLVRTVLRRGGVEVISEAANGTEALARFAECEPPDPSVVLLDNQMPDLSGLEVARRIRTDSPHQVILLFSAYLSEDIVVAAEQAGVTACVAKTDALKLDQIVRSFTR